MDVEEGEIVRFVLRDEASGGWSANDVSYCGPVAVIENKARVCTEEEIGLAVNGGYECFVWSVKEGTQRRSDSF